MTKEIQISKGKIALVDDDMFEYLNQWTWTCMDSKGVFYAHRKLGYKVRETIFMHNVVNPVPKGFHNDHIDGNGLNNQRHNLRECTQAQNTRNARIRKDNTSGYKGVHWNSEYEIWVARIQIDERRIYLGRHNTPEEAARAYDVAAKKYHKEFARLNFPD